MSLVRDPMVRGIAAGGERQEGVAVLLASVDDLGHRVSGSYRLGEGEAYWVIFRYF